MIEYDSAKRELICRESQTNCEAGGVSCAGRNSTGPLRLQRMNTDMCQSSWNLVSRSWRRRICVVLYSLGLVVFLSSAHSQQGRAPIPSGAATGGTVDIYSDPTAGSETQEVLTDTPPSAGDAAQTGESTGQASSPTMSADQIISILKLDPTALQALKEQIAQQTNADPGTIGDEALFTRIRQSDSVRVIATQELTARGYSIDEVAAAKAAGGNSPRAAAASVQDQAYNNPNNPQVEHKTTPYADLPSLSDLYSQFPSAQEKLHRFGSDAFQLGSGNVNQLPTDVPVGPEYVLGPGDYLILNLWGSRNERIARTVDRQGQIGLPEAGSIMISGLTIGNAQVEIEKALNMQFQNEHVELSLGRVRTVRVYIVGDVQRPGAYDVSSLSTLLSALYEAGGPSSRGSLRILRQYRGKQLVREVDLYDFLLKGVREEDDRLLPGDTILVPPAGPQVTVQGMVRRPAIYELNGEQGLDQILELAGGVLVSASLKQVNVERIDAHQSRTMFSLQLPDDQAELHNKLAGFKVKDGDSVEITQILPYTDQAVYVQGHVLRPGKFPYHDGMSLSDLLHSYEDVLPEPSDHAEIIRLQAPDYRPATMSFNLRDVLTGDDPILLRPFDVIRVYGRYEVDSPTVSIQGEVLRPGTYPMSEGLTLAGLVKLAGGFRRSALRDEADLSSYTIQDDHKVVPINSKVEVEKALDGDKSADVTLKPGDVVSIRRLAGWQDIGATISINGEIMHPGTYGITEGERLSTVLKRAGGFTTNAYPFAAVLERTKVREMGEQARQEMIRRLQETPVKVAARGSLSTDTLTSMTDSLRTQKNEILEALRNHPASGRLAIRITSDISSWENTSADIELRAGDTLVIPKRPNFVMITGQVYNQLAISYAPGKKLDWYLKKAGGATPYANKKDIYVLRADGTVVPRGSGWIGSSAMDIRMRPGDTIYIPEKIVGGSVVWQNILATAQIMSAAALPIALVGVL
jgi:protein involved in polysaccharide export with SLBB domain